MHTPPSSMEPNLNLVHSCSLPPNDLTKYPTIVCGFEYYDSGVVDKSQRNPFLHPGEGFCSDRCTGDTELNGEATELVPLFLQAFGLLHC
ncbi:hypothetical protein CRG98_038834 [Punica granatum]|uniref:Uncharacterized protein n=1 Tax=Punica granatum TaxID=22663 RepID=A0A2I0IAM9_PUNGR|nr:hypothetical protein CRG98_038834 [Punica granatum]